MDNLQDGLMTFIRKDNLLELLGIHADESAPMDRVLQSRVEKLQDLFATMLIKKDRTVGTMLALLRTILLSNLIEATSVRLQQALQGFHPRDAEGTEKAIQAPAHEFLEVEIKMGTQSSEAKPTKSSYCPEAWDPRTEVARQVKLSYYDAKTCERRIEIAESVDEVVLFWEPTAAEPDARRCVRLCRKNHTSRLYPLEQIRIRFTGGKLVGYGAAVWPLRDWLRKEFIPFYIHHSPTVDRMNKKGRKYLGEIFDHFMQYPFSMHSDSLRRFGLHQPNSDDPKFILRIVEHLQGMTDRYLERLYSRLFMPGSYGMEIVEVSLVDGDA
jgi:hypothetical protein